jgi:pullulanase/glycogen debranching enzyme
VTPALQHRTGKVVERGTAWPLGATPTDSGVNFALYSQHASAVFLLLFDAADGEPTDVVRLEARTKYVWHAHVQGVRAGQLYGYKVQGEHRPAAGLRFNEHKLLLDPYAKSITGPVRNTDNLLLAYTTDASAGLDLSLDTRDSTRVMPKCVVVDDAFDWQGDASPEVPLESLIVYEVHTKGFTAHPSSRVEHPGTYLGFIEKIPHLTSLGVNAVELLPVHEFYVDDFLLARGLTNYWGYNSIGFFAPTGFYSTRPTPGADLDADQLPDLSWFGPDGGLPRWHDQEARTVCVLLDGGEGPSAEGDYLLFAILNAHFAPQWVQVPAPREGIRWARIIDTTLPAGDDLADPGHEALIDPPDHYLANPRSVVMLIAR